MVFADMVDDWRLLGMWGGLVRPAWAGRRAAWGGCLPIAVARGFDVGPDGSMGWALLRGPRPRVELAASRAQARRVSTSARGPREPTGPERARRAQQRGGPTRSLFWGESVEHGLAPRAHPDVASSSTSAKHHSSPCPFGAARVEDEQKIPSSHKTRNWYREGVVVVILNVFI
jgi:hypothetical protein